MNLENFEQGYTRADVRANPSKRLFPFREEMLVKRAILTLQICSGEQYQAPWQWLHHNDVGWQHRVHGWLMSGSTGYISGRLRAYVNSDVARNDFSNTMH